MAVSSEPQGARVAWLTIPEIALRLRISKMTAYRLVHTGDIPAHRIGHSFRIAEIDFDAYLARTRNEPS